MATKLKLLNINAHAELLLEGYSGPRLNSLNDLELARSKSKDQMVLAVLDALKNLMAAWCLQSNINTNMGFLLGKYPTNFVGISISRNFTILDAVCYLDKKCNPIPLKKVTDSPEKLIK